MRDFLNNWAILHVALTFVSYFTVDQITTNYLSANILLAIFIKLCSMDMKS